jgi:pilus assembly protein TadC
MSALLRPTPPRSLHQAALIVIKLLPVNRVQLQHWILGISALLMWAVIGWQLAFLLLIVRPLWVRYQLRQRARSEQEVIADALPDGIDILMLLIYSGCTPIRAFEQLRELSAPALWPAVDELLHRLQRGQALGSAMGVFSDSLGPHMMSVVDALRSADHYGTALGPSLDRISDHLVKERQQRLEIAARTLSVRITFPLVLCILPAFTLGALGPVVIGAIASLASFGNS